MKMIKFKVIYLNCVFQKHNGGKRIVTPGMHYYIPAEEINDIHACAHIYNKDVSNYDDTDINERYESGKFCIGIFLKTAFISIAEHRDDQINEILND